MDSTKYRIQLVQMYSLLRNANNNNNNKFIMLLVFISVILIFTAPGVCYTRYINDIRATDEICPSENFLPMGINRWANGVHFQHRGQKRNDIEIYEVKTT
ncbi:unnamed protein product [Wuchereria bancrofti]|uniref:Uncharacterized protein n=1 Tax=Wuchereria bancrofti TaxID=6293 RepID=A0A3P7FY13_WUCBA|nr:unnamed protein product [Wuchereria bancrofti]